MWAVNWLFCLERKDEKLKLSVKHIIMLTTMLSFEDVKNPVISAATKTY